MGPRQPPVGPACRADLGVRTLLLFFPASNIVSTSNTAGEKLTSDTIFPLSGRTTSVPVLPVFPRKGRNMQGRKILRATHISASHLFALLPLAGNREQKRDMPIHPQGRVFIAPEGTYPAVLNRLGGLFGAVRVTILLWRKVAQLESPGRIDRFCYWLLLLQPCDGNQLPRCRMWYICQALAISHRHRHPHLRRPPRLARLVALVRTVWRHVCYLCHTDRSTLQP